MSGPWIAAFVVLWILVLVLSALVLGLLRRVEGVLTAAESRASSLNPSPKFGLRPGQIVGAFVGYDRADKVVETITATAKTGQIGDGKIFVVDVDHVVRIRTGETDTDAL